MQNADILLLAADAMAASIFLRRQLNKNLHFQHGEMTEWLKVHAWKACVRETVPRVRIPLSPPLKNLPRKRFFYYFFAGLQMAGPAQ